MTKTHTYRGVAWLDLESPTEDEIAGIIKRYDLHPLVGEELRTASPIPKIEFYDDYMLVVLTLPVRVRKNGAHEIVDREIDFVVGKNFLITCRTDTIEQLEYFAKIFEANSILNKEEKMEHAGFLFYYIVKRIYAGMIEDLENIRDSLKTAEERIFGGEERKMVEVLSGVSRELIDIRQTVRMHRDIWEDLVTNVGKDFFGNDFKSYVRDIRDEFNVIHEIISNSREMLTDLRETNDSLLSTKQNEIIKVLTLVAFIFYPLSFIAALFTIPATNVPIVSGQFGWLIILLGMIALSIGLLSYFRKHKWL